MENSPNNPAYTVFLLAQTVIKFCDLYENHQSNMIKNLEAKVKEGDETIKKSQEKYNTLDESKKKNDTLLHETSNSMKDLKESMKSLADILAVPHIKAMEEIYHLNEAGEQGVKGELIRNNQLTEAGQVKYNKLMDDQNFGKERIAKIIDDNKHKEIINKTLAKYGEMYKGGNRDLIGANGKLTQKGNGELCMNFLENFVGRKVKELVFDNKIENSMVKSEGQDDKNPGIGNPEPEK